MRGVLFKLLEKTKGRSYNYSNYGHNLALHIYINNKLKI